MASHYQPIRNIFVKMERIANGDRYIYLPTLSTLSTSPQYWYRWSESRMVIYIYGANGNTYIDLSTLSPLLIYPQYRPIHNIDLSTILSFSMELLTLV